jgi:RimJ/RimL family protein N-acetyltransferase
LEPRTLTARDGSQIVVRQIGPEDRALLDAAFQRLSPESRHQRFFGPMQSLTEAHLDYLTDVDHHDHEALVALDERGEHLIGVTRYVRIAATVAEAAITVADDWQGRGVGTTLVEVLVQRALEEGIQVFSGSVLADNPAPLRLIEQAGDVTIKNAGAVTEVEVTLQPPGPVRRSPVRALLQAIATGALKPARDWWRWSPRSG